MRNFSHFPVVLSKHGFAYYISPVYFIALFFGENLSDYCSQNKKTAGYSSGGFFYKELREFFWNFVLFQPYICWHSVFIWDGDFALQ